MQELNKRVQITLFIILSIVSFKAGIAETKSEFNFTPNPRIRYTINEDWKYYPNGIAFGQRDKYRGFRPRVDALWESVSLPHTWNSNDPFDDQESYRRGISWYRKYVDLDTSLRNRRFFLYFEGANQEADVYMNGAFAGNHKGGYTGFAFDVTDYLNFDDAEHQNLIALQVDNSHDQNIPPLSVGYALYGGIYRDVWLIITNPVHVKVTDHASSGVFISTPRVTKDSAIVEIRGTVVNDSDVKQKVDVRNTIVDHKNQIVQQITTTLDIDANAEAVFEKKEIVVEQPHLWSPDDPYLYNIYTEIFTDGKNVDRVKNPLGFRWFSFHPDKGFALNGNKLQIRGTNRHQDLKGLGHALPNSQHVKDLEWIKKMGANFVRLAHYPQDPIILETCDRLGLLVWEEIPLVNYMNISNEFLQNSKQMLKEMIRQHYNHPSVIMWGSMNEIFLWSETGDRVNSLENNAYKQHVRDFAFSLDSLIRHEDPGRYTAMAFHGSNDYKKAGIDVIPQVQGWNIYHGWYGGKIENLGPWLDKMHHENPDKILFISEYGAGSDVRLNAVNPQRFDFTGNWQRRFHELYLKQIDERPYLAGTAIWNQFDFSQPYTGGSIAHVNQKGMQTWDRKPKDVYYFYKANWNPEPMIYIASRDWAHRIGRGPEIDFTTGKSVVQPVDVYSNLENIELFHNGISLGVNQPDAINKAVWDVPFIPGNNFIDVRGERAGKLYQDFLNIEFTYMVTAWQEDSDDVFELFINAGYNGEFIDDSGQIWLPDQSYQKNSYGHIGGRTSMFEKDLIIIHCKNLEPVYSYYLKNIKTYRLDVPDGDYEVELYFAEPEGLNDNERVFNVLINDQLVFKELDLVKKHGVNKAASRCFIISVTHGNGLNIVFEKIIGEPILNALRVKRK